jgi:lysophospholipase L1-like esterase
MPIIKAKPRTMEDGTNIISYTDSVGPSYVTYTFEKNQECLIIRNKGIKPIVYSVGTTNDATLHPGEEHQIDTVFNSFKVKSSAGIQAFEIRADEEGNVGISPGLAQEVNKLSSQLAQTTSQVTDLETNKMDKNTTDISVSQINKNKGKIDQTYLSDELIQQMAGNTPINAIPAPYSVTVDKLAFAPVIGVTSKNLFNKNDVIQDTAISPSHGGELPNLTSYVASNYIRVDADTEYTINKFNQLAFYDENKVFLSGLGGEDDLGKTFTTPLNTKYIRVTVRKTMLNIYQLEKGISQTLYEPFGTTSKGESLEIDFKKKIENAVQYTNSKNMFNKDTIISGKYVSPSHGGLLDNTSFSASDYIEVEQGQEYTINLVYQVAFYSYDKQYVSGIGTFDPEQVQTVTVPYGARFMRLTVRNTKLALLQVEKGTIQTEYVPYGKYITESELSPSVITKINQVSNGGVKSPKDIFWDVLQTKTNPKIKLLGDSITHGEGGTGFLKNGALIPGTDVKMNPDGYCWANLFRDLMQSKFNATVLNYAQTGTRSEQAYAQRETLIEDTDDLVIMQYGTNDRHNLQNVEEMKVFQRGIIETAYNKGAKFILMTANPASVDVDNDPIRNFGMFDVDKATEELAREYGMTHISNYDAFLQYAEFRNISVDTLMPDQIHPNDEGYDVMFRNVVRNLGISYVRPGITK